LPLAINYVVLDACDGMSKRTAQVALLRITYAGATTVSAMTLAGEIAGDFRESNAQAIGIVCRFRRWPRWRTLTM